jgi:hypothetical protein
MGWRPGPQLSFGLENDLANVREARQLPGKDVIQTTYITCCHNY